MKARIAVVDDQPRMAEVLAMVLARDGHRASFFDDPLALLAELERDPSAFDLVVTDLRMPQLDGVELLARCRALRPQMPVLLVTAHATVATAVAALKEGAFDYLQKPVDNDNLRATVARALEHRRLERENSYLRTQVQQEHGAPDLVAASGAMQAALDLALRAARSKATVLITGESGTGKEVLARAIHVHSDRVGGPLEAINCKALSPGVLESELFGHSKGAFTGANRSRAGVFERAHGGTLFLDEIGEIDGDFQGKLLRALQEGEIRPVGADQTRKVDVRVIAATNKDLQTEIRAGRFREDLYFRLAVVPLHIAPLRERRDDILPLAHRFLAQSGAQAGRQAPSLSPEVERWLLAHDWPGNVRELQNCIERGVVLARTEVVELSDLLLPSARATSSEHDSGPSPHEPLHAFLDRMASVRIRAALEANRGARQAAARELGIERTTLYRLLKKYDMED